MWTWGTVSGRGRGAPGTGGGTGDAVHRQILTQQVGSQDLARPRASTRRRACRSAGLTLDSKAPVSARERSGKCVTHLAWGPPRCVVRANPDASSAVSKLRGPAERRALPHPPHVADQEGSEKPAAMTPARGRAQSSRSLCFWFCHPRVHRGCLSQG